MAKQLKLDSVIAQADGAIFVKLLKQFVDDDNGEVVVSSPHRFPIEVGEDVAARAADVETQLRQAGYPALDPADVAKMSAVRAAVTPG